VFNHRKFAMGVAVLAVFVFAGTAMASHYSLFGNASIVSGGNPGNAAQLVSDATAEDVYAGVDVSPTSPIAWADLDTLSVDYSITDDDCGGGSPMFYLGVDTNGDTEADGYVRIALGPSPFFTDCATGWQTDGNLIGLEDGRYDYSMFGGSPFTGYSDAPASVQDGDVVEAFVVVDGYWNASATGGDGEQTVLVDNLNVDGHLTTFDPNTPDSKDACKKGGWQSLERADSSPFKNQGDCIQYYNTGK
jgi:hypothetical protein